MTVALSDNTLRTCETFRKAVAGGEHPSDVVGYLAVLAGVRRPAIYQRLRVGGVLPGYNRRENIGRKAADLGRAAEPHERLIPPTSPVDRDPCPRCGVRRDIGCNHAPVRLGTVF